MIKRNFRKLIFFSNLLLFIIFIAACKSPGSGSPEFVIESIEEGLIHILKFNIPGSYLRNSDNLADYYFQNNQGVKIPVQIDENGKAIAILTGLNKGSSEKYRLKKGRLGEKGIRVISNGNFLSFSYGEKKILNFQVNASLPDSSIDSVFLRAGFIHPVFTPSGKIISDSYAHNHLHHHGIWTAWTKTIFEGRSTDFWNMGDKKGKVALAALDSTWTGPVSSGFVATLHYLDMTGKEQKIVLKEKWEVHIYNLLDRNKDLSIFDIDIEQINISGSTLSLPEYHYGGLGFRGHSSWNGEENTVFLTSEGRSRIDGHGTTSRWCHIGGKVDGSMAGITIMNHPQNFRFPQNMRIHPTEPFFCFAPSQQGDWEIKPDEMYKARYRFVVYDGDPDVKMIESIWKDYSQPLKIQ
jgi:hypothetical protein